MSSLASPRARSLVAERATLIGAGLGFAVIQLDVTVVNVAIKQIGQQLGGGVSALQWVVDAYTLLFASLILLAGALGDRLGSRRMYLTGFVIFAAASMMSGLAPALAVLVAAGALQGVGAALLGANSLALINHTFTDPARRARAVGWYAAAGSTALAAGPVIGGVLLAAIGWRAIFFINLPIGAVGWWLTWRYTPQTPRHADRRLDPPGAVTAVLALGAFAAAVIEAGAHGITDPWVAAGLIASAILAVVFVVVESRSVAPMLPLSLFRRAGVTLPTVIGLAVNVVFYGLIFVFSLLWQAHHGYSPLRTGLGFVPMTAAILAANLIAARVARRIGPPATILTGIIVMIAGCAGLLWTDAGTGYLGIVGQQLLLGGGLGLLVPPLTASVLGSVERSRSGVASGTLVAARQAGSVLGVAIFGSLIATGDFYHDTHTALVISTMILISSAIAAAALTVIQQRTTA